LLFNNKVSIVRTNIDICLLAVSHSELTSQTNDTPSAYVALGELKGGIDPGGADEHWKTASKALSRIRVAFARYGPVAPTFFVGAAIATRMAQEIWTELEDGTLHNAANLNDLTQVSSLCQWLVTI
jgi:type II restriction enzyme